MNTAPDTHNPSHHGHSLLEQFRLDQALEAANIGIWEWNLQTGEVRLSYNVEQIIGLKNKFDKQAQNYLTSIVEEDRNTVADTITRAIRNKADFTVEHRVASPDGSVRWIEGNGKVIFDAYGKALSLTGTVKDITERRKKDAELKQRDQLFTSLAQITSELILHTDWEKAIPSILQLLGEMMRVDRVYIFQNDAAVQGEVVTTSQRYEWNSGVTEPQIDNPELQHLNIADMPGRNLLEANKPYYALTNRIDDEALRALLESQHIVSVIIFPIFVKHTFWGFIGFDDCQQTRHWTDLEFSVLQSFASSLSGSIERKQFIEAISESEQRFRTLQEASFGGIGLHDQGIILDCNKGLCDLTGYRYEELIGMNGFNLIVPECRDLVKKYVMEGYDKPYDVEGIRKDGSRYFLEIHGRQIPYRGKMIRVTEFRDITERKLAEEKIREQNIRLTHLAEDLTRKNDQLEEFTQIVSHNLRSPAGNIVSLVSLYEQAKTDDERVEYFNLLKQSGEIILGSLTELNEVLKIKQNHDIESELIRFDTLFNQVKNMLSGKIMELDAVVMADFSGAPEVYFPGIYLESILLNLLSNSLKYNNRKKQLLIRIESITEKDFITLRVSDNGLGINLERYGHQIFKMRKTFHHHPEARGIGLFLVKNQVEAMGGNISVESTEGVGSTFIVKFKRKES